MFTQIILFALYVGVNSMIVPAPCQRPVSVIMPSVPPCANQFSMMSVPYEVPMPCNCNPPVKYIESLNCGCAPNRCGPVAEIVVPEIMPVPLPPVRCGPIGVPNVVPVGMAPARCGRIAEIAVPEMLPLGVAPARCGRIAEIAVPEILPIGMAPASCGRIAEIAVPDIMPLGVAPVRCGIIPEIGVPEIMSITMGNPFLPAASPVSALAPPFYPYTPPICPCECKCQYLKKIPIPPPCI